MAVLQRDQLLAARAGVVGDGHEARQLPTAREVPTTLRKARSANTTGPMEESKPGANKENLWKSPPAAFAQNELEEVHTPKGRSRKNVQDLNATITPEKCQRPAKPVPVPESDPEKGPCKHLNAYANEFVPGGPVSPTESIFASVCGLLSSYKGDAKLCMPPVLPAIPLTDIASVTAWANSLDPIYKDPIVAKLLQGNQVTEDAWAPTVPQATSKTARGADLDAQTARALTVTACLLNFFFQNHVLQTTPIILDIIESQLQGVCPTLGPWSKSSLNQVSFCSEDLAKLDQRLGVLLNKLPSEFLPLLADATPGLNLRWQTTASGGRWVFKEAPELRRIVPSRKQSFDFAVLAMSFERQEGLLSPSQLILERFLRLQPPGVACFQGLDVKAETEIASSLVGKGYDARSAQKANIANTIAWDRRLWTFVASAEEGSAIIVDLAYKGGLHVRFACLKPSLADCVNQKLRDLLRSTNALVVCADLSLVGGAAAAALVPGLAGMRSAMFEMLQQEVSVPLPRVEGTLLSQKNVGAGLLQPMQDLWDPSGMYFLGVEPVAALSEHSEGYLATMSDQDAKATFPGRQAPLLAEFDLIK